LPCDNSVGKPDYLKASMITLMHRRRALAPNTAIAWPSCALCRRSRPAPRRPARGKQREAGRPPWYHAHQDGKLDYGGLRQQRHRVGSCQGGHPSVGDACEVPRPPCALAARRPAGPGQGWCAARGQAPTGLGCIHACHDAGCSGQLANLAAASTVALLRSAPTRSRAHFACNALCRKRMR
jgi:hypothetical protein